MYKFGVQTFARNPVASQPTIGVQMDFANKAYDASLSGIHWNSTGQLQLLDFLGAAQLTVTTGGATMSGANTFGAASVANSIVGPLNRTVGASTAAAGSTTLDAGVLPAGTAGVYPTTAADGTKGVRVHASDKVTGRMIWIGNGVSNQVLKVYAPSGGTINGAAADAAFSSVSGKGVMIYCLDATGNTWLAW